jgi:hypothetical protein
MHKHNWECGTNTTTTTTMEIVHVAHGVVGSVDEAVQPALVLMMTTFLKHVKTTTHLEFC